MLIVNRSVSKSDNVSLPSYAAVVEKIPPVTSRRCLHWPLPSDLGPRPCLDSVITLSRYLFAFYHSIKGLGVPLAEGRRFWFRVVFSMFMHHWKFRLECFLPYWFGLHNAIGSSQGWWLLESQLVFGRPRLWCGVNQGGILGPRLSSVFLELK